MLRNICALAALLLLSVPTAWAEKDLARPPGTTRYAPLGTRLRALLAYDRSPAGAHRMTLSSLGTSVQGRDIWMVTLHDAALSQPPSGKTPPAPNAGATAPGGGARIFYLCRQHGHEPASTEGALAFVDALVRAAPDAPLAQDLRRVTLYVVPMANPDGAEAFLRHNAHDVDLNRDWLRQTQPETRAWLRAIKALRPTLMTDQHELYPDDTRPDFTETAGLGSGANVALAVDCMATQAVVQGALLAEGYPTVRHLITDRHPARLAHRYGCVTLGIPTVLFETNRLTGRRRSVAARAAAHAQFMADILRDAAGERAALRQEAQAWQAAHARPRLGPDTGAAKTPPPPSLGAGELPTPPGLGAGGRSASPGLGAGGRSAPPGLGAGGRSAPPDRVGE